MGGTYPSPAARTCSCQRGLPAPTPRGRTGLETPGTRFREPCRPKNSQASGIPIDVKMFPSTTQLRKDEKRNKVRKVSSFQQPAADRARASSHSPGDKWDCGGVGRCFLTLCLCVSVPSPPLPSCHEWAAARILGKPPLCLSRSEGMSVNTRRGCYRITFCRSAHSVCVGGPHILQAIGCNTAPQRL